MSRQTLRVIFFLSAVAVVGGLAFAQSANDLSGRMAAYFDGKIYTIDLKAVTPGSERHAVDDNRSLSFLYTSDAQLPNGRPFTSVLDDIRGVTDDALWQEVQIAFNDGFTPHQFTSDSDITGAAAAGEIRVVAMAGFYRCTVIRQM